MPDTSSLTILNSIHDHVSFTLGRADILEGQLDAVDATPVNMATLAGTKNAIDTVRYVKLQYKGFSWLNEM